jgi:hypothetical protein
LWKSTGNVLSWLYKLSSTDAPFVITSTKENNGLNVGTADHICAETFQNDIAHITLSIADPTVLEVVKDVKLSFPDMLGTIGK